MRYSGTQIFPQYRTVSSDRSGLNGQQGQSQLQGLIRLLLVDDHAIMRQGLRSVLEAYADVKIVGEAGDGEEAIACVHNLRPSIVAIDINMPKLNGIAATRGIKATYPEIKVIGLSVNADKGNQEAMMKAGADLLLPKEAALDQLYRAICETLMRP